MSGVVTIDYPQQHKRIRIPRDEIRMVAFDQQIFAVSVHLQWNPGSSLWVTYQHMTSEQIKQLEADLNGSADTDATWVFTTEYGDRADGSNDVFTWTRDEVRL